jgi:hypothetical protein
MAKKGNRNGTPDCGEHGHSRDATTIKPVKSGRHKASGKNLVEAFLSDLDRSWQQDGRDTLKRLRVERPMVYFKAMVRLTQVLHRQLRTEPREIDRRHYRADVLLRLQQQRMQSSFSAVVRR